MKHVLIIISVSLLAFSINIWIFNKPILTLLVDSIVGSIIGYMLAMLFVNAYRNYRKDYPK